MMRRASLRRRLAMVVTASTLVALTITGSVFLLHDQHAVREAYDAEVQAVGSILGANLAAAVEFGDPVAAQQILSSLQGHRHVSSARVVGEDGLLLARYHRQGRRSGEWVSFPILRPGTTSVVGYLRLRCDQSILLDRLPFVIALFVLCSIIATALAVRFSAGLRTAISSPIHQLIAIANNVERTGNYAQRLANPWSGELGALVDHFNAMMAAVQSRDDQMDRRVAKRTWQLAQRMEELREAEERALAASDAKTRFLANMSHEIRTPLNGVLGIAELLSESSLRPEQRRQVETIAASGRTLLAVLGDVLDLSKIEAGELSLESEPFEIWNELNHAIALFHGKAAMAGLDLQLDIDGEVPGVVRGDALRLRQVISNLVGNALKFTEAGFVRVRVRRLPSSGKVCRLRFEVQDSGVGVDEAGRKKIFAPFQQADGSTTRRYGGTGLGLSISRALVSQMGGELDVRSAPGEGSSFFFECEMEAGSERAQDGLTVLIVEPDLLRREVALGLVELAGQTRVQAVADMAEAEAAMRARTFDTVWVSGESVDAEAIASIAAGTPQVVLMAAGRVEPQGPLQLLRTPLRQRAVEETLAEVNERRGSASAAPSPPGAACGPD